MAENKGFGAEARSELVHTVANELGRVIRDKYPHLADKLGGGALPKLLSKVFSVGVRSALPDTPLGEDVKMGITELFSELTESDKSKSAASAPTAVVAPTIPPPVKAKEKLFALFGDDEERKAFANIIQWLGEFSKNNPESAAEALGWLNSLTKCELLSFASLDGEAKDKLWALHYDDSPDWKDRLQLLGFWLSAKIGKPLGKGISSIGHKVRDTYQELDKEAVAREGVLAHRTGYLRRELAELQRRGRAGYSLRERLASWRL